MEKLLFIAEKPSLMKECKTVYMKNRAKIPYDIDFVALAGHVCHFENPKSYSEWDKKWAEIALPMVPDKWKIGVIPDKKKLFDEIANKAKTGHYDGYICGTDSDREGNLIYYLLQEKANLKGKKTYRFWVHDLTDKGIMSAFSSMVDMSKNVPQINLTNASILRSKFDWLVGMNFTISATVHSGGLMKIGRVKTPTLKIVYDNCNAIDNFKPVTTYEIESQYKEGFSGFCEDRYKTKAEAEKAISALGKTAKVISVDKKTVPSYAPPLYKLSDLQIEAGKAYGYSPDRTLKIVQALYEKHKVVSYPRTDCRYISSALAKDFAMLLKAVEVVLPEAGKITSSQMATAAGSKKYVNDAEVNKSSHTALMPTGKKPDLAIMDDEEKNILGMIYRRFLAIFYPPLIEEKCVVITQNIPSDMMFKSNGKIVKDLGYTVLYPSKSKDTILPPLKKGDIVNVDKFAINDKTSTPPERLTTASLIKEMENIGKYIDDKDLKAVMKEAEGIGTPATRASIIEALIKDGYMEVKKSKKAELLYITNMGKSYINNLKGFSIVSPELTAEWEKKLRMIERDELPANSFETDMLKFIHGLTKELGTSENIKKMGGSYSGAVASGPAVAKCPKCGGDIVESPKAWGCNNPECGCVIFKDDKYFKAIGGKMTKTTAVNLFKKGEVVVKGLKSKKGNTYDARIKASFKKGKYPEYSMEFLDNKEKK